ncbi:MULTISPECIES: histidinol-phosphate transaminase [Chryseobacterium]|uniref:histidinol-phosphate transaminase n=1 Tax=Chryseobacterium TaxID=59732 RepID=UPI0019565ABB|nr:MULTISPECIES: histidinol-phosphate transaminase [Chryseobacterium]MBM7420020.1 histidinol-phosphate aminotransferase [Chryseobacterium sp. JUb44]MDH6209958.1 histidinol-phosphate aminotransferase [Chryseobacterium sp. BIGb0186]WSO08691.1 histidinol-phosphate transaminase [Chryseobacterium scophthalmum]
MKEFNINSLVRKNILELQPYISFRDNNEFENPVLLDANESPFGELSRYPDSTQKKLKQKLSEIKNVSVNQIAVGNGSDELIDLIIKVFCEPKKDSILMMDPSFAMYGFYASINENKVIKLDLNTDFEIVKDDFLKISKDFKSKVFFLCSPNNPTGNSVKDIEFYIKNFNGIVVVDEAYIEFSGERSCIELLEKYPNLIVLQTFSKAWGMAGVRVGIAYSSKEIVKLINTVKAPYNVNSLSSHKVIELIDKPENVKQNIEGILNEISWLENEFQSVNCIKKVYPTDANFFLIEFEDIEKVYEKLLEKEILTSKRSPQIPNCIRINVGTREENIQLIEVLKSI